MWCVGPDNLWNYSAPIIARFAERITGSFRRRVYRQYLSPHAPLQQPLGLTYSADFMGHPSRYRNYGGLWDIKSKEGKDEELTENSGSCSQLAAGRLLCLLHLRHDSEGQCISASQMSKYIE